MNLFKTVRSTFLASALVLASLPGCQGESLPGAESEADPGAISQALTCTSVVPVMTSATAPSGTVTRSGAYSSEYEAWKAFDDPNSSSMWISAENQTPAWISYQLPAGTATIHRYAITFHNGPSLTTRGPKDWTLEGWNGSSWVVIDTRTNQTNWGGYERREFPLAAPATYGRFRLNVTDDNDTRSGVVVVSMRRLELLNCVNTGTNPVTSLWTKTSGVSGAFTRLHDLVGDPAGRSYFTGMTTGGLQGNAMVGVMDAYLHARDWNGTPLWSKQIGAPGSVTLGYGMARNSTWEEIFMGGFTDGSVDGSTQTGPRDAFLTKYRYTGVRQWTRQVGGSGVSTEGYGVAVDGTGNSFLVGAANGGVDGNTRIGNYDAFVTKYDTAGTRQWTRQFGKASTTTHGRRAATDAAGNVYVSGWTTGGLDGNALSGAQDAFLVKYDAAGVKQWTRQFGSAGNNVWLYGAATDASGNVYLTGYSGGGLDVGSGSTHNSVFLVKYDGTGTRLWTREFGSAGGAWGTGLYIDTTGVYVSGSGRGDVGSTNTTNNAAHNFVAKFDTAGNRQWVVQQNAATLAGAPAPVHSNGVNLDSTGNIYLGGYVTGVFDGNPQLGDPDLFVTKLPAQ